MNKDSVRQFSVIFSTLFTLVTNGLAVSLSLNGRTTGQISDSFNVLFVPAGYVFAIWAVIYLGLLAYTVYQALPSQRQNPLLQRSGWWVTAGSLLNGVWILFWHYGFYVLSLLTMLSLLGSLVMVYLRLGIGRSRFSAVQRWTVAVPFSIYLGWITVATIANVTAVLADLGWRGGGISELTWTLILLAAGVVIAALMAFTRSDIAYLLVLVWAFAGISVRWSGLPVLNTAGFWAAAAVLILLIASRIRPFRRMGFNKPLSAP